MLATVTGDLEAGYRATITLAAAFQTPAPSAPTIPAGGVTNAARWAAGVTPGAWSSIYGTDLAIRARSLAAAALVNHTIPTSLGGVSVQVNGKPAFVQYVSPKQVNVLTPSDTGVGSISVTVTNSAGTSNAMATTLQPVSPGLFVASGYVRAVRYPDGVVIEGNAPANGGDVLALYGTGFGAANSAPTTGKVFTGAYETANSVTVTIGGLPAQVLWAGLVGPGLCQINVVVPAIAAGDQEVVATIAGARSQSGARLKVGG